MTSKNNIYKINIQLRLFLRTEVSTLQFFVANVFETEKTTKKFLADN